MCRKDLLGMILRPREGGLDDLGKNYDDGMNLGSGPDLDCQREDCAGKSS
jgi:hypothetical protein